MSAVPEEPMNTPSNISVIPLDIIYIILSQVDSTTLRSTALVNSDFLAQTSPYLWQSVRVSIRNSTRQTDARSTIEHVASFLLKHGHHVRSFRLTCAAELGRKGESTVDRLLGNLAEAVKGMKRLDTLGLVFDWNDSEMSSALAAHFKSDCAAFVHLATSVKGKGLECLLKSQPRLKALVLSHSSKSRSEPDLNDVDATIHLSALQHAHIHSARQSSLFHSSELTELSIQSPIDFSSHDGTMLLESLTNANATLTRLTISVADNPRATLAYSSLIISFPTLQFLSITHKTFLLERAGGQPSQTIMWDAIASLECLQEFEWGVDVSPMLQEGFFAVCAPRCTSLERVVFLTSYWAALPPREYVRKTEGGVLTRWRVLQRGQKVKRGNEGNEFIAEEIEQLRRPR